MTNIIKYPMQYDNPSDTGRFGKAFECAIREYLSGRAVKATEELFEDMPFCTDYTDIDADAIDGLLEDVLYDAAKDEELIDLLGWD